MEARFGQNYLIKFLPCIFNFMSFVFNSTVERINFMTCISNFLIRPVNFMLHAFNYIACKINFMLDIFNYDLKLVSDSYSWFPLRIRSFVFGSRIRNWKI